MKMLVIRIVIFVGFVMNGVTSSNARNVKVSSPDGTVTVSVGVKNH